MSYLFDVGLILIILIYLYDSLKKNDKLLDTSSPSGALCDSLALIIIRRIQGKLSYDIKIKNEA